MSISSNDDPYGLRSPGGFVFGVSGWVWGDPKPRCITFYLDGTAQVSDQHGRPIRGALVDNKEVIFASGPPCMDDPPGTRAKFATHMQVIAALEAEGIKWERVRWAGWPQIPYEELKKLPVLPPTPIEELRKIKDSVLRKDALRIRREVDAAQMAELGMVEAE